jgi:arylsulfatase A-like enzyme
VLFISVDDLRPELGSYGAPVVTPNIDRLAATGYRFEHAYTEIATCAASRASLITGTYSRTTGVFGRDPPLAEANPALATMPGIFKRAGYESIEIGKFLHRRVDAPTAFSAPRWQPNWDRPRYAAPENRHWTGREGPRGPLAESAEVSDASYDDGRLARRAVEALGELRDRPFFMALGFKRPHLPLNCPARYWQLYDEAAIEAPKLDGLDGVAEQEFHGNYELSRYANAGAARPKWLIHAYRACVSYVDAQVGLVLDELERLRLAERTVVVLWGDHGFHLGEHGIWGKFTLLETSLRVPLILRVPGRQRGVAVRGLVETVDILPTLCELTGLEIPAQVEGISFETLLDDPGRDWKGAVFGSRLTLQPHFPFSARTVRTPRHRMVSWHAEGSADPVALELYDHEVDPREYQNLADEPGQQTRVAALSALLDQWQDGNAVGHPR